jgi:heptose I phosphotransferase
LIDFCAALRTKFSGEDAFDQVLAMDGEIFRNHKGRKTLRFFHDGAGFFLKIHPGVGWKEILKNLVSFRLPVLGARNEHEAILALENLNVETMRIAGYGERGTNPATMESFLITEEVEDAISLEDLTRDWLNNPPAPKLKRALINKVAAIARTMHQGGVNHRDFYLCHFLLKEEWLAAGNYDTAPPLHVIDLHRTQIRSRVPRRWLLKDLAGLHFSSMDAGLTARDRLRFLTQYEKKPLKQVLSDRSGLWSHVEKIARKLYRKHGTGQG